MFTLKRLYFKVRRLLCSIMIRRRLAVFWTTAILVLGYFTGYHPPQKILERMSENTREIKIIDPDLREIQITFNTSSCPVLKETAHQSDLQMLAMYKKIIFDDKDGGVWKQGWDIQVDEQQWSPNNKLKVFIVPHSHNDPGWRKTFEQYYKTATKAIISNMVKKLSEGVGRKFIWAESSFLSLWWNSDATVKQKAAFRKLLHSGQIEIVTGGWVMNDEANSHWLSIIQQLTIGHQWLLDNLDYIPKNGWAIDPFGHSSTQPYLLKLAGFENTVIQRVHYRVKKELAMNKQLEFKWRQMWDGVGETDLFTHMMPFYSYNVAHSCGPDPKICCQFDFKRLISNVTCEWGVRPQNITQKNVQERASVILDQLRKKAQLYRSSVVLFPLGDDFMYSKASEWDAQYRNYEAIIQAINNNDTWNAEVRFGTLRDYFAAVHEETSSSDFPVLSGDFFTYADVGQHYWSGHYASRPFYKSMDRVLLAYVRAAEILIGQATASRAVSGAVLLRLRVHAERARRALALFQHHDAVAGTSRAAVHRDYGSKMLAAINDSQWAIQLAAYHLLRQPPVIDQAHSDIYLEVDDVWRARDRLPSRLVVALRPRSPSRRIVLYNALPFRRSEVLTVMVSTPYVEVWDNAGVRVPVQVSPEVLGARAGGGRLAAAAARLRLSFAVAVPALALTAYTVVLRDNDTADEYTWYARVREYNAEQWGVNLSSVFPVERAARAGGGDILLRAGAGAGAARLLASPQGLLRAVVTARGTVPLRMELVQYESQVKNKKGRSKIIGGGAYLFGAAGAARPVRARARPHVVVAEGPLAATLYCALLAPGDAEIVLATTLYSIPGTGSEVWVRGTLQLEPTAGDIQLAARFSTAIRNGDEFYTDLNGMQMTKRRYLPKLPLQANFYPLGAAAYIQDEATRFTLLTSTPLGVAALRPGQIEVLLERRMGGDDGRGLGEGVVDNLRTRHTFRLLVEHALRPCQALSPAWRGQLTARAHAAAQALLQPLVALHYSAREGSPRPRYARATVDATDLVLASFRSQVSAKDDHGNVVKGMGMTFQRVDLETCYGETETANSYPISDGQIELQEWIDVPAGGARACSLTFVRVRAALPGAALALCPMEVRSVFIPDEVKLTD